MLSPLPIEKWFEQCKCSEMQFTCLVILGDVSKSDDSKAVEAKVESKR